VFGIDGLQALHLAMKCATAELESMAPELAWWERRKGTWGMPRFLPDLPKPQQARLQAVVEREACGVS
jgi:hypothetical protein